MEEPDRRVSMCVLDDVLFDAGCGGLIQTNPVSFDSLNRVLLDEAAGVVLHADPVPHGGRRSAIDRALLDVSICGALYQNACRRKADDRQTAQLDEIAVRDRDAGIATTCIDDHIARATKGEAERRVDPD
jgi:hypothetical protein